MRFIDRIVEVDAERIVGSYTWTPADCAGYNPDAGRRDYSDFPKVFDRESALTFTPW